MAASNLASSAKLTGGARRHPGHFRCAGVCTLVRMTQVTGCHRGLFSGRYFSRARGVQIYRLCAQVALHTTLLRTDPLRCRAADGKVRALGASAFKEPRGIVQIPGTSCR
mmetsp:Transcript_21913/g.29664  ORF Transcript_21913/g.29664 Transcript_21913/m.29664 type:complete len:110 (+) Transcript_21913:398-727(+)